MSSTNEIEILLKKAITLLHSSHASSATELRLLLDEEIKKRHGTEKTITNSLSKKQLEDEANFPGRAATPPPQPVEEEVINLIHSPTKTISDSPDTIADSDDAVSGVGAVGSLITTTVEDETNLKEFGDLNCCVCGEIRFTATNRLIECSKCGALYHQECHKPPITDEEASEEQGHNWQCENCMTKPAATTTISTKLSNCVSGVVVIQDEPTPLIATSVASIKSKSSATSSRSSSSSNSSSPYHKIDQVQVAPVVAATKTSKLHRSEERTLSSGSSKVAAINSTSSSSVKKHSSSSSKLKLSKQESKRKSLK